ncbi:uncharacterized protein TRIVIDRAFT_65042 [Trichoderma virens Gv29-8]|uniref:Uncharacterized protein n=1 Tax=Hypocrea virens (strain Gv29-8 / FGSC 10586) TaxID=413071 RepID=G9NBD4_HYPVG|nr:uncharacterized protein TRIVIDRAFT_65042 [Trichoderma virens Gv29-8]EHK16139.1 hypothetical protein TRIVIDRAFT_65042 [Trichoderma virens Gv29-8]UKZ56082.1 hypothetical protein TrVGV298_009910 [Trichoderma virens]
MRPEMNQLSVSLAVLLAASPLARAAPGRGCSAKCNAADSLVRLLRAPSNLPEALPFCSSYLHLPASTVTVTTVTPTTTAYSTILSDVSPTVTIYTEDVDTVIPTRTVTVTNVHTETNVVTDTSLTTEFVTVTAAPVQRRIVSTPLSQQIAQSFSPSRISSGCGCLTIPLSTTSVTATAPTVTVTETRDLTTTEPEATQILTSYRTTTLAEAVETTTIDSTTVVPTTTTQVSVVTSTVTATAAATPTGFFYIRNVRPAADGFFSGNFLVNRDFSTTNKVQAATISGSNSTAPRMGLTPEGYLTIMQSRAASSSATGTEDQTWVAFVQNGVNNGPLSFDKLANVQACSTCRPLKFVISPESDGTYINFAADEGARAMYICGSMPSAGANFYAFWTSITGAPSSSCFLQRIYESKEGVAGPTFGTPTHG